MHGWQDIVAKLENRLKPSTFSVWFRPLRCRQIDDYQVVLDVPNQHYVDWIQGHYLGDIQAAVAETLGAPRSIVLHALQSGTSQQNSLPLEEPEEAAAPAARPTQAGVPLLNALNPDYTLDDFVVGPSNQFAHAAAIAVAEGDASSYNPLFIYGGVGLGKTHLMQAIGNAARTRSNARVLYLSSEQFTVDLINCIERKEMGQFRERYRANCDIILIDDIQFIAGKERTQEEFFHTFNALYANNKRIVLTSDKSPQEIPRLEERLQSRFSSGLIADIQRPEMETRVAILKKKAAREGVALPDEVGLFIANHAESNIRELEGCFKRVIVAAKLNGGRFSVELARSILEPLLRQRASSLNPERIVKLVSNFYNVRVDDILHRGRTKQIALARQVAMYLARKHTEMSYPDLGRYFGKDHSTVISAFQKIEGLALSDSTLRGDLNALERNLLA